jgi:hypothetical protein
MKRRFLQEPYDLTSHKTAFFRPEGILFGMVQTSLTGLPDRPNPLPRFPMQNDSQSFY